MTAKAFGKLQGAPIRGRAVPQRAANVTTAAVYEAPRPSNYDDIVGNAFQGGYHPESYDGMTGYAKPAKGLRFVSGAVDFILLCFLSISIIVLYIKMGLDENHLNNVEATGMPDGLLFFLFIFWIGYGIVMEASKHQGTVGKIVTGTVVINKDGSSLSLGQVVGRNFGKIVSSLLPVYIAYFMVFWTKNGQTLHDMMCGSVVYRKSDLSRSSGHVFD